MTVLLMIIVIMQNGQQEIVCVEEKAVRVVLGGV